MTDLEKRNEALALWRKWNKACDAYNDASLSIGQAGLLELEKAEEAALTAYRATGRQVLANAGFDDAEHCAITGAPLFTSDDIAMVLRSALPGKREEGERAA